MFRDERIYAQYAAWCQSLGITPATFEAWIAITATWLGTYAPANWNMSR